MTQPYLKAATSPFRMVGKIISWYFDNSSCGAIWLAMFGTMVFSFTGFKLLHDAFSESLQTFFIGFAYGIIMALVAFRIERRIKRIAWHAGYGTGLADAYKDTSTWGKS
jgi:hypothetical protein